MYGKFQKFFKHVETDTTCEQKTTVSETLAVEKQERLKISIFVHTLFRLWMWAILVAIATLFIILYHTLTDNIW